MNLNFQPELALDYHSRSQIARVLTEYWVGENMFCPRCGNSSIKHFANNEPVADFFCPSCNSQYELKSKNGKIISKINDGAYETMLQRITSNENPDFFFMSYSISNFCVTDFILVPKHFFVPSVIEKRKPLASTAKRAGWVGCNILLSKIPKQGRISIIHGECVEDRTLVMEKTQKAQRLRMDNVVARGWLLDVLNCINTIPSAEFELEDVYHFENMLAQKHPNNNNIRPKIRQQLQLLRDRGIIKFASRGKYQKC